MKHLKESAASHSQAHSHAHTGTGTGTGTGTIYEGALNDRESRDAKTKENAKRMQFIKMEEIPLKLDQNVSIYIYLDAYAMPCHVYLVRVFLMR
jgi:hypothetical protein